MRRRGWIVTFTIVTAVIIALGLTVFGLGPDDHAVASAGGSAWLWSTRGELARVNAETGKVDTRFKVTDAQGHTVDIDQTDGHLILRDRSTGKVSTVDLSTLHVTATTQTAVGVGIVVALHDDDVFVIDEVQGLVRQLDASTLQPMGSPLRFAPGLAGGVFDNAGNLWLAIEDQGTIVSISPSATGGPKVSATYTVAAPGHDLMLSALDKGVAVVDNTSQKLTMVRAGRAASSALTISGAAVMPTASTGSLLVVTVSASRRVYVFGNDGQGHSFAVPASDGDGARAAPDLAPGVSFAGHIYCADNSTGKVYVLDQTGTLTSVISIPSANGPLQLEARGSHLFINAPGSSSARVVDSDGGVKVVNKYSNGIQGGDPPPDPPRPPVPPKPRVGPPGIPPHVRAVAGDKEATVTWGAAAPNGSAVLRYVVVGDGKTHDVSAKRHTLTLTGLANGTAYNFSVYAVNAKGSGRRGRARPVTPTSDVPDAPKSVTAEARPDGSVRVSWPAAFGEGHKISQYSVTALSASGSALVGQTSGAKLDLKPGTLTYGTQYAFTVIAVNDKGASSQPSPVSNTVTPFAAPSAPKNVRAQSGSSSGSVVVAWTAADENGRAIAGYTIVATAGLASKQATAAGSATAATLTGFGNGADVAIKVHAVNEAGDGPSVTVTTRTFDKPAITAGSPPKAWYNSISVPFTVNDNGNAAKCAIAVNGAKASTIACTGGKVSGLWPATAYSYVVTATNNAGSSSFSGKQTTPTMNVTVICDDQSYCGPNAPKKGVWVFSAPSQNSNGITSLYQGDQRKALCWTNGSEDINAKPWGGKQDSRWIQVPVRGDNYIPFAWVTLDGGDDPSMLPKC